TVEGDALPANYLAVFAAEIADALQSYGLVRLNLAPGLKASIDFSVDKNYISSRSGSIQMLGNIPRRIGLRGQASSPRSQGFNPITLAPAGEGMAKNMIEASFSGAVVSEDFAATHDVSDLKLIFDNGDEIPVTVVPEPGTAGLAVVAAAAFLARR